MHQRNSLHASWKELLGPPAPGSHFLQIYDREDFLASAVAHFTAQALKEGEAVLLSGTPEHLRAIRRSLRAQDADPDAAARLGQLIEIDAAAAVDAVMKDGMPDPALFDAAAGETLARARADERFCGVRWWGEMSNVLFERGDFAAGLRAEELGDAVSKKHGVTLFCSYLYDRFDPAGYARMLREVCCKHSHVIPADDYAAHRIIVNRAIADVMGHLRGSALQALSSWKGLSCELPSSQALLFWLHEAMPEHFEAVLARARAYQAADDRWRIAARA